MNLELLVVMDNLNLHTTDEVRKAIEDTGAKLVFLPTYSPDLSPIEMFWSNSSFKFKKGIKGDKATRDNEINMN